MKGKINYFGKDCSGTEEYRSDTEKESIVARLIDECEDVDIEIVVFDGGAEAGVEQDDGGGSARPRLRLGVGGGWKRSKWAEFFLLYGFGVLGWLYITAFKNGLLYDLIFLRSLSGAFALVLVSLAISHAIAGLSRLASGVWPDWRIRLAAPFLIILLFYYDAGLSID
ncbi:MULTISPECIES: hypothetical protein [unclassified Thioalkalivibrio]|uniref:hypothetical protein n=1 Tax=unclassified Thioalkalivibrio TaxID=2621013 RepID=UPI0012DCAF1A|nr:MULTISPECIES: hypothetical protein [unclassified Thioalkalivibrio]